MPRGNKNNIFIYFGRQLGIHQSEISQETIMRNYVKKLRLKSLRSIIRVNPYSLILLSSIPLRQVFITHLHWGVVVSMYSNEDHIHLDQYLHKIN